MATKIENNEKLAKMFLDDRITKGVLTKKCKGGNRTFVF